MRTEFLNIAFISAELPKCVQRFSGALKWFVTFFILFLCTQDTFNHGFYTFQMSKRHERFTLNCQKT